MLDKAGVEVGMMTKENDTARWNQSWHRFQGMERLDCDAASMPRRAGLNNTNTIGYRENLH